MGRATTTFITGGVRTIGRRAGTTIIHAGDPSLVLDLQFARDQAYASKRGPLPTFTRASQAWRVNSAGIIVPAAINTPRIDYDPTTLACRGLLIEEQRTNLCLWSEDLTNAAWLKTTTTALADQTLSPDGTADADLVSETAISGVHAIQQINVTSVIGVTYTSSMWVKKGNGATAPDWIAIRLAGGFGSGIGAAFNVSTGLFGAISGVTISVKGYLDGWWRVSITATATSVASFGVFLGFTDNVNSVSLASYTGSTTSNVFVWGAQLEVGAFATSPIPTTSAAVVRSADVCSITGGSFTSFFNATEGTLVVKAARLMGANSAGVSGFPRYLSFDDVTSANRIHAWWFGGPNQYGVTASGVDSAALALATVTGGTSFGIAARYKANDFAASQDGGAVGTDVSGSLPTVTALGIGQASTGGGVINGHIRAVQYYNRIKTNAQLQTLSTP